MRLFRHTRIWPTAGGYAAMMSLATDAAVRDALELWGSRVWPLIVRRPQEGEAPSADAIAVGLALPPSLGKRRLGLVLPIRQIAAHAPPLMLDDVVGRKDFVLAQALTPLARAAVRRRIALRVFGSVAWQAETGLDYLHNDSDVDLIAAPNTRAELASALALLERAQRDIALRLDGEIVFPDGDAVAWREWARPDDGCVLVKNHARVALVPRRELESKLDRRLAA